MLAANDQKVPATDGEEEGYKLDDEVAGIHEHRTPLVRPYEQPRLMGQWQRSSVPPLTALDF